MKQATMIFALLGAILLAGCGGGNGDTTSQSTFNNGSGDQPFKPTTHLSHRSLVTNYRVGDLAVMDAFQDRLTAYTFPVGAEPTYMQLSPDGTLTLVNNTGSGTLSSFNNNLEAVKATIYLGGSNLPGLTQSFVTSTDNTFGFAAVPSYNNGLSPALPGAITRFNPTDGILNSPIPFPYVSSLAIDPAEQHLLAFTSGNVTSPNADNNVYWVDLTEIDPNTNVPRVSVLTLPTSALTLPSGALSRPIAAFFSSDGTKAYILNCGTECGGASAPSVVEIDAIGYSASPPQLAAGYLPNIYSGTATVVQQWPVNGASRGLIDTTANKLYVAGSLTTSTANDCPFAQLSTCSSTNNGGHNVQDGYFTVIDLTLGTASAPIRIGNGAKTVIRNINGIFWVGSVTCGVESCISLVNPSTGTASVLANTNGNGTGISLQANSGEVYTIEGGELFIYDQNGNPVTSQYNTDILGPAYDVLYIN